MPKTRPRNTLNQQQTEILQILYKFRFATVELIAKYQELDSNNYTNRRLKILVDKGYIGRNYDGSYKIHGKQASYYLLLEGIRILKKDPDVNHKALDGMRRDGSVGEVFIQRCLDIFGLYTKFSQLYGEQLSFYSKSELMGNEYFLKPLPDAYITIEDQPENPKQFLLDIIETSTQFAAVRRRLLRYITHYKSGDWGATNTDYPVILLICENALLERRLQRLTTKLLSKEDIDELSIQTTTMKAVMGSEGAEDLIWSSVDEPGKLTNLDNL